MLWIAALLAFGIVASRAASVGPWPTIAAAIVLGAVAAFLVRASASRVFVAVAFVAAGAALIAVADRPADSRRLRAMLDGGEIQSASPAELEGTLRNAAEPTFDGYILDLDVQAVDHRGQRRTADGIVRLYVGLADDVSEREFADLGLTYGTRILVACRPERDERYLNPGVISRKELLDRQKIDAVATVKSPLLIEVIDPGGISLLRPVFETRVRLIGEFNRLFNRSTASVMTASLLGERSLLDRPTAQAFREGGTFHVLVISGLHITFIGGLVLLVLNYITRRRVWQFVLTSGFLWLYTLAVGADVPVVRASVMFTALLLGRALYRESTVLNSLGVSIVILLVWRPADLFDPSFQLTVVSVAAIVAIAFPLIERLRAIGNWTPAPAAPFPPNVSHPLRWLCETLYWRPEVWNVVRKRNIWTASFEKVGKVTSAWIRRATAFVFEGLLVSLIVQVALLPLTVIYFHRITPASPLLNLWVGGLLAVESFSAVFAVLCEQVSRLLALPLIRLAELANALLLWPLTAIADTAVGSIRVPIYSGIGRSWYLLYFVPLLLLAALVNRWDPFSLKDRSKRERRLCIATAATIALVAGLIALHPFSAPRPTGRLSVDLLDVGQGDAILVTFPNGETMLVDGGGQGSFKRETDDDYSDAQPEPDRPRIGEAVVSEFLWEKGYSSLDHIVATHADSDHIQGLVDVATNFRIGQAYFGTMPPGDADLEELTDVLRRRGVPTTRLSRGDVMSVGDVRVEVLHPARNDENAPSDNEQSVVLRIVYGSRSILLTGDIEALAESALVSAGGLKVDAVKVPHHGSRTSSTDAFVDAVDARIAVISVGRRSLFGHPNPDVVQRWRRSGADVLTTGDRGTVTISTDGSDLRVESFVK
jgi:competence protein ComEC